MGQVCPVLLRSSICNASSGLLMGSAMSTPGEMVEILMQGMNSGNGVTLVVPDGKPFLTCRGEILSVTGGKWGKEFQGYNVQFTAKQCKKMLEHLMSELSGAKVTATTMPLEQAEKLRERS